VRKAIDAEKFMERLREGLTPSAIIRGKLLGGVRVRGIGNVDPRIGLGKNSWLSHMFNICGGGSFSHGRNQDCPASPNQ
jgi:hypothetical protein